MINLKITLNFLILTGILAFTIFLFKNSDVKRQDKIEREIKYAKKINSKQKTPKRDYEVDRLLGYNNLQLNPIISEIILFGNGYNYQKRSQKISQLKEITLSNSELQSLYLFLKESPISPGDQLEYHSLKNDLLNHLIHIKQPTNELGILLAEISADKNQHQIMREYSAQFIYDYCLKKWPLGSSSISNSEEAELHMKLRNSLWDLSDLQKGSMAGTAISKLHELSLQFSSISKTKIADTAYKIAIDGNTDIASRMGAVEVLSHYPSEKHISEIKRMAIDHSSPISLKMVAIANFHRLKVIDQDFDTMLNEITTSKSIDKRLQWAAQKALTKTQ